MRRQTLLVLIAVLALLVGGAVVVLGGGDDEAPETAAPTTTTEPVASTTTEPPPLPPWTVEIAIALVPDLEVLRERPTGDAAERPESTVTTAPPTTAVPPGGPIQVTITPAQSARIAATMRLSEDEAALELVDASTPPLPASPLEPAGAIGASAGETEQAGATGPRAAPAPSLPLPTPLTPIPSPGLEWGSTTTETGWRYTSPTPSGNARVFLVAARDGEWVQLVLPTRPNNQLGWAHVDDLQLARHRWHLELDISDRLLRVWEGDRLELETKVVVGKDVTPTPLGRFYLNERVKPAEGTLYSPWILSTNAFSDSLERFSGEVPIFALHGGGYASNIGNAISNGCIRIPPDLLGQVAPKIPMGTPIDIFQ